jgi:hypothetical protein
MLYSKRTQSRAKTFSAKRMNPPDHRRQALENTDEEIGLEYEFEINEAILFAVARLPEQKVGLRLLLHQRQGRQDVSDNADEDHLNITEGLWKT